MSLPTAVLGLPNKAVTPEEEEDDDDENLGLTGLFWLPILMTLSPPSVSAPEPRRSKRMLSIARYYATLTDIDPRKAHK